MIVFVPCFQKHATLRIPRSFDQTQNLGVVPDGRVHFADADRYVPRAQHTIDRHDLTSLRCCGFCGAPTMELGTVYRPSNLPEIKPFCNPPCASFPRATAEVGRQRCESF